MSKSEHLMMIVIRHLLMRVVLVRKCPHSCSPWKVMKWFYNYMFVTDIQELENTHLDVYNQALLNSYCL